MLEQYGKSKVEINPQYALRLSVESLEHIGLAAKLLKENKIGIIAFNGIYGLFTNADDEIANNKILEIKNRPTDKNLILVSAPEHLDEHVDFNRSHYPHEKVIQLQRSLHALGVILPAGNGAPSHITLANDKQATILSIWTEYEPLRKLIANFRQIGGRAFTATSANKGGQPTHTNAQEAWQDFKAETAFILEADFSHLPDMRKQSTSVVDLTQPKPLLYRLGNVSQEEIQEALLKFGFPDLQVNPEKIIFVRPRK